LIGTPAPKAPSSAASSGGGGACARAFQQRVSQREGASQARTARSALGQERGFSGRIFFPRSGTAGSRLRQSRAVGARRGQASLARGLPPAGAERRADQRPVPADGGVAADLEVRPPELALDAPVAVLGPDAPRIELGDLLERGAPEVRGQVPRRPRRQAAPVGGDAEGANRPARAEVQERQLRRPPGLVMAVPEAPFEALPCGAGQVPERLRKGMGLLGQGPTEPAGAAMGQDMGILRCVSSPWSSVLSP